MLTLAAIGIAEQRAWTLPGTLGLTDAQKTQEQQARKTLADDLAALEANAADGSLDPNLSRQVAAALDTFRGVPTAEAAKWNRAGQDVLRLGMKFATKFENQKAQSISQYVETVYAFLDDSQHATLAQLAQNLETGAALAGGVPAASSTAPTPPEAGAQGRANPQDAAVISSTPGVR